MSFVYILLGVSYLSGSTRLSSHQVNTDNSDHLLIHTIYIFIYIKYRYVFNTYTHIYT